MKKIFCKRASSVDFNFIMPPIVDIKGNLLIVIRDAYLEVPRDQLEKVRNGTLR